MASDSALRIPHSALLRGFAAITAHAFRQHARVPLMGWVVGGLLGVAVAVVGLMTASPAGWGPEGRRAGRGPLTYSQYAESLRYDNRLIDPAGHKARDPHPFDPVRNSVESLILTIPAAVLNSDTFRERWAYMHFTRWVVFVTYLGFLLPLFTLAYASASVGGEREGRSLVWLLTRPVPRSAVYLAKFLGTLPWCLLFGVGGFFVLCAAGGEPGRRAAGMYWPAAAAGTVAMAALFHLIGSAFRRPVVVGLVYLFFFEVLVVLLPGSLKKLSLSFYARSLMYNEATAAGYPTDMPGAAPADTAWAVLLGSAAGLTALGMWWFARAEHPDDV